ncbi:MAG: radical SAM protein [Planctomycetota bacterium]|nr:radical SAM protein [Planctomycetota bacterium]
MPETLRINEIFHSIQGESTHTGRPCVFVRLAGCHLRCAYCDTEYAFKEGQTRVIEDIIAEVASHDCDLVEITGGEPLLQPRVHDLMTRLCDMGRTVLIETSGACDISSDPRVIRIMDIKTPASGESHRTDWSNLDRLLPHDEIKFVICDRNDYEWSRNLIEAHNLQNRVHAILMSPVFEQPRGIEILGMPSLPMRTLAEWILQDNLPVRLQTQLHKHIWDPQTRGV